mgnify:CR=1 FL=1
MTETVQMNQTGHRSKIFIGAFIAMLIGSAILLLTLFMPFASATDEYKEALEKFSDSMYMEELNMTNKEAINISLFEFIRIYSSETGKEISNDLSIVYVVVIAAFAVFALLTLLFSIFIIMFELFLECSIAFLIILVRASICHLSSHIILEFSFIFNFIFIFLKSHKVETFLIDSSTIVFKSFSCFTK